MRVHPRAGTANIIGEMNRALMMDMSFANQALSVEHIIANQNKLDAGVYPVPKDIDQEVGRLKLESLGIHIDALTPDQIRYQESWEEGT